MTVSSMRTRLWRAVQWIVFRWPWLPLHWLSALLYHLARSRVVMIRKPLVWLFMRFIKPNMSEAQGEDPEAYANLDALFTRALKPELRPWPQAPQALGMPCDGRISHFGVFEQGTLIQAKEQSYTTAELLVTAQGDETFAQGGYATFYLGPQDCHRVFMPSPGRLLAMRHVPGHQISVDPWLVERVPRLFACNERVVSMFRDPDGVAFAVVMVGAVNVASVETAWHGLVSPRCQAPSHWSYSPKQDVVQLNRGDEMGCFHFGSTVVVLWAHDQWRFAPEIQQDDLVRYGQTLATREWPA